VPTYSTRCEACSQDASIRLSFVDYESVKLGVKTLECTSCQGVAKLAFNPGDVTFVLKDGPSGGFVSKALKENKYRVRRREIMTKREQDHVFKTRLIPNHAGVETDTWRGAQEEARKEGGAASAATYDPLVRREQAR
jgi:hypothetical protein